MRRWLTITIAIIVWIAVITYIVISVRMIEEQRDLLRANSLTIVVSDSSKIDIVRVSDILEWLDSSYMNPVGRQVDSINTHKMEALIAEKPFVHSVEAYSNMRGEVNVVVTQREPMFRVTDLERGYDFYYTTDGYITPVQPHSAHYVPIITGDIPLPFEAGYTGNLSDIDEIYEQYLQIFDTLRNFVGYIATSTKWSSAFQQIVFEREALDEDVYCVRLVPSRGEHSILIGELDDYEAKLARLDVYYGKIASVEGWNKFNEIDVRYNGQVVGRNRLETEGS